MATHTLQRLPDAPIILSVWEGSVTVDDVLAANVAYIPHFEAIDYDGYLVIEITRTSASFAQVFQIIRSQQANTTSNAGIRVYLVGVNALIRLFADLRAKDPNNQSKFSIFRTMDDALAAAHASIAREPSRIILSISE